MSHLSHQATPWKVRTTEGWRTALKETFHWLSEPQNILGDCSILVYALEETQQNICLFSIVVLSSLPQHLFSPLSDVLTYIRKVKYLQQLRQTQQIPLTVPLGNPSLRFSFQGTTIQVFLPIKVILQFHIETIFPQFQTQCLYIQIQFAVLFYSNKWSFTNGSKQKCHQCLSDCWILFIWSEMSTEWIAKLIWK